MMSTRSGRIRKSIIEVSPPRTRKGVSPTRSPARNRKSSPSVTSRKSPSRKSPSRKPAPKHPVRKSPSRTVKETKEVKETEPKSPSRRLTIKKDVKVDQLNASTKIEPMRNTRTRRSEYSVADFPTVLPKSDSSKNDFILNKEVNGIDRLDTAQSHNDIYSLRNRRTLEETAPRRSSRLKEIFDKIPDIRRSFSKSLSTSVSKSISQSIGTYSDEEDAEEILQKGKSESQSVTRKLATPLPSSSTLSSVSNRFEFAGRAGAIALYILIPLTVLYILISCSKACIYISLKEISLCKIIPVWFNVQAAVLVISNILLQAVFLSIPVFGTKEIDDRGRKYYFNTFVSTLWTLNILFALGYFGILKIDTLLQSYLQMATVSYLMAVLLSLIMFFKSYKTDKSDMNPYGNSGHVLYDFFMGREIQAAFMKINVKLWISRVSNISTLIFSILIFKHGFNIHDKEIGNFSLDELQSILYKVNFKPTIIVYSMMQMIYTLYFITREKKIVSTFYWHSEGLGYLQIVSSALYPYYFTSISKYVADTDLRLTTNTLTAASALFLLGFLIMLISSNIKYEFRKNPMQPSVMYLDSMPTFLGKKLLVSNLWGLMRHPNYSGDILIHAALALPGILSRQLVAASPALLTIVMLLHRCRRDHDRCRRRYGAAWQRYCVRVPSVIIPNIL